jgi:uncharacterized membrane protein YphA (DoxX/SURF4 family)
MLVSDLRKTRADRLAGALRLMLAIIFLMSGPMKLLVPHLAEAWSAQLLAANIPLYSLSRWTVPFSRWTVPFVELLLGVLLLAGFQARLSALVVIAIMVVATYVHVVVDDPSLFPLQPSEPLIPLVVIAMSFYILRRGAGAWSLDLKSTRLAQD